MEYYTLNNGVQLPKIGYGTYKIPADETYNAVTNALNAGYRHIDTASFYGNEAEVGRAIGDFPIDRGDVFVTTKLWTSTNSYEKTITDVKAALERMNLNYLDLVLIHWPIPENVEIWKALEDLYNDGLIRAIGTSNFKRHHLREIIDNASVVPMVNQIELHPYFQQILNREFCKVYGIQIEAWSPLLRGGLFFDPVLTNIATKHDRTIAQVTLRFLMQEGISCIPKSVNISRMKENIDIFDFELDEDDMEKIRGLNKNIRYYRDPDKHGF